MSTQDEAMRALMGIVSASDRETVGRNLNYTERRKGGEISESTNDSTLNREGLRNFMLNGDFSTNGEMLTEDDMRRAEMEARNAGAGNINFIQPATYNMNQTLPQMPGQQPVPGGYPPPYMPPYGYAPQYPTPYAPYPPQPIPVNDPRVPQPQPQAGSQVVGNQEARVGRQRPTPKNAAEAVYQLYDDVPAALRRIEDNQILIMRALRDVVDALHIQDTDSTSGAEESERPFPENGELDASAEDVVSQMVPGWKEKVVEGK